MPNPSPPRSDLLVVALHGYDDEPATVAGLGSLLTPEGVEPVEVIPEGPLQTPAGRGWFEPGDAEGLAQAVEALESRVRDAEHAAGVPRARTVIVGYSQGATVALSLGLTGPSSPLGVVALAGFLTPSPRAFRWNQAASCPVLLTAGVHDQVVPVDLAHHAVRVLQRRGVPVTYRELDVDHRLDDQHLAAARSWLAAVMAGASPADPPHDF